MRRGALSNGRAFSAFKFGAALALLFAFVGSGFVFGKEGWYKIAEDIAVSVETFGKGFDVGFTKASFAISATVQSLGEGFETGTKTVGVFSTSLTQTFGKGFDTAFENAAPTFSSGVIAAGDGFDTGLTTTVKTLGLKAKSFGHVVSLQVQSFGQGFDTRTGTFINTIPSYVLSLGNGFDVVANEIVGHIKRVSLAVPSVSYLGAGILDAVGDIYQKINQTVENTLQKAV